MGNKVAHGIDPSYKTRPTGRYFITFVIVDDQGLIYGLLHTNNGKATYKKIVYFMLTNTYFSIIWKGFISFKPFLLIR